MAVTPASTGSPAGAADYGPIYTLLSQLLKGSGSPVGLGFNPPQSLGPSPVRPQTPDAGGAPGAAGSPDMSGIWAALAPFLALLGGGAGNVPGGGNVSISDPTQAFLQQILTSLLSPASASPIAGTVPAPVAAVAPAATPAFVGGGGGSAGGVDIGSAGSIGGGGGQPGGGGFSGGTASGNQPGSQAGETAPGGFGSI